MTIETSKGHREIEDKYSVISLGIFIRIQDKMPVDKMPVKIAQADKMSADFEVMWTKCRSLKFVLICSISQLIPIFQNISI